MTKDKMASANRRDVTHARRLALGGLVAICVGLAAVLMPQLFVPMTAYDAPVFPFVRTAIEGVGLITLAGLFIGGAAVGWLFGRPIILGLLTMLPFYLFAIIEIVVDPRSHQLWIFEFFIYVALSVVAIVGALLSTWVKQVIRRDAEPSL